MDIPQLRPGAIADVNLPVNSPPDSVVAVPPPVPNTPTDPPFSATPAGDHPAGVGIQPDAVGRGDSSASPSSLADGPRGDAGAGSVGAGGAGCFRFVNGCLVAGG
jgi:hypothetical protein